MKKLLTMFLVPLSTFSFAQVNGDFVIITVDRNTFYGGHVIQISENSIKIKNLKGDEIAFRKDEFAFIEVTTEGYYQFRKSRLLSKYRNYQIFPSAIGLKRKQVEYRNVSGIYNQVSVGLTDNIMITGGGLPIFDFNDYFVGASLTVHTNIKPKIHLSLSSIYAVDFYYESLDFSINEYFSATYGKATFGTVFDNFTIGFGIIGDEFTLSSASWKLRLSKSLFLLNENTYLSREDVFFGSLGLSYMFRSTSFNVGMSYVNDVSYDSGINRILLFTMSTLFDQNKIKVAD